MLELVLVQDGKEAARIEIGAGLLLEAQKAYVAADTASAALSLLQDAYNRLLFGLRGNAETEGEQAAVIVATAEKAKRLAEFEENAKDSASTAEAIAAAEETPPAAPAKAKGN